MPSTATNRREKRAGKKCPWTRRLRRSSKTWAGKTQAPSAHTSLYPAPGQAPLQTCFWSYWEAWPVCCNAIFPLGSTGSLVGRRLAIIGDDINKRYDAEFRYMLKSLQLTKENAYDYFIKIASR